MNVLSRDFYNRNALLVAPDLLGKILVRQFSNQTISGRIVEVEAYLASDDPAAHAYKGQTKRNASLFQEAGHAYVYSIHNHFCLDIVTEIPTSVLLRALEPLEGTPVMQELRGKQNLKDLTSGPGKLAQALGITKECDGLDIIDPNSHLSIIDDGFLPTAVTIGKRIGISQATELEYRFYIKESPYISRN